MSAALGKEYEDLVTFFDRMRTKRNQAIYDVAGLITETQARGLYKKGVDFVALIEKKIGR